MLISVNIDDDVLDAVKRLAARQNQSVDKVLSDLARRALRPSAPAAPEMRDGFRLISGKRGIVTTDLVNRLRDEEP